MEETGYNQEVFSGNQNGKLYSKVEVSQDSATACQQNLILSPTESRYEVNGTSSSFQPTSHLESCGGWSCQTNMVPSKNNFWVSSDQVQPNNIVAMETTTSYTPPLQALRSLCNSISSTDVLNVPQASQGALSSANFSECTQISQFDLASISQGTIQHPILPETSLLVGIVSSPFVPETQNLWRPWAYEHER